MAKFQIATPGGYEVEIEAANESAALEIAKEKWQTLPKIIFKGDGNVRVFERSSGERYMVSPGMSTTDPDKVAEILKGKPAGEVSKSGFRQDVIAQNPIAARANEFVRGVPFLGSYADEAVGLFSPKAAQAMRTTTGAMQAEKPGQTAALNVGGGLLGAAVAAMGAPASFGGALTGGGSRLANVARGAGAGATAGALEGAVYGAGEGTDAASRTAEAARFGTTGAAFGGLLGGAAPLASEAVGNIVSYAKRSDLRALSKTLGVSEGAAMVIKDTFEKGGGVSEAIEEVKRAGQLGMLADAGEAAQALLDATAASGGRASQIARTAVDERVVQSGAGLKSQLDQTLGAAAEGPVTAVREIQRQSAPARAAAYNAAMAKPIDYAADAGRQIESVLDRMDQNLLQKAVSEANAEMLSMGMKNQQIMASIGDDGTVIFREMPNVAQLDQIKRALDAAAREAKQPVTGIETQQSMRYSRLASELRDALSEAVPEYKDALRLGGDTIREREAFLFGRKLLKPSTNIEDVTLELGAKPSKAQLEAAKRGLRTEIERVIGEVKRIPSDPNIDARQAIAEMRYFSSDNARAKLSKLLGPEAEDIIKRVDEASKSAEVRAAMSRNSQTAIRTAIQSDVEQMTSPGMVGNLMRGEPVGTTKELVRAVTGATDEMTVKQKQAIYADIARALTEARGDDAQRILADIGDIISRGDVDKEAADELMRAIGPAIFGGGLMSLTRPEAISQRNAQ